MLWDIKSDLSTVHYSSIHSANLMILLDAATKDTLFMETVKFFCDIRRKKYILHSDKYSIIRHSEQGKCEWNMTQSKGAYNDSYYLTHL